MANSEQSSVLGARSTVWRRALRTSGFVAGVFSLIVCGVLLANWVEMKWFFPRRETRLTEMKKASAQKPDDAALAARVRAVDLRLRQMRFYRQDLAVKGAYLLLGCVTACLACLKGAQYLARGLPHPQGMPDRDAEQIREAMLGRRAVTIGLGVVAAGWVVALVWPGVRLGGEEQGGEAAGYPSMEEVRANWPSFRGPEGSGVSAYANIATEWDGATSKNVVWKSSLTEQGLLPGKNSPVVWGDRVFFSGGTPEKLEVYCFDLKGGAMLWRANVPMAPQPGEPYEPMEDTGVAANTMVTDGRRAYAIFATGDMAAVDYKGQVVWSRSLGLPESVYGYASSLAMYQNLVIVQYDQASEEDGKSKVMGLDAATGHTVWETKRPVPNSWSSPVVARVGDAYQLITAADPWVIAYNPADGAEIWRAECIGGDVAPSPILAGGKVFAVAVYNHIVAVKADGKGDVSKTHVAKVAGRDVPDITSPVSNGELLWTITTLGVLTCWDAGDAAIAATKDADDVKPLWDHEFRRESFNASPSLVGDKLYVLSDKGIMHILATGREFKELGQCVLKDEFFASPAFVDGRMILRGVEYLWCIGGGS